MRVYGIEVNQHVMPFTGKFTGPQVTSDNTASNSHFRSAPAFGITLKLICNMNLRSAVFISSIVVSVCAQKSAQVPFGCNDK